MLIKQSKQALALKKKKPNPKQQKITHKGFA